MCISISEEELVGRNQESDRAADSNSLSSDAEPLPLQQFCAIGIS